MTEERHQKEGLRLARFVMVLSSFAPLFVLWAIKGISVTTDGNGTQKSVVPDVYFVSVCLVFAIVPTGGFLFRYRIAKRNSETQRQTVACAEDQRDHVLVYLFAMLLPFYTTELATGREVAAALAALGFIVFLFWHLNLHYMNILFAILGYHTFRVIPTSALESGGFVLITRRTSVAVGLSFKAYRLSDFVYLEVNDGT